jgi:hypothetical protein
MEMAITQAPAAARERIVSANAVLTTAVRFWFVTALAGQRAFLYYIVVLVVLTILMGAGIFGLHMFVSRPVLASL